ncbi:MAG: hypothetical protein HGA67_03350 [Candidatus Yonathbacteria bacterium]|nr:hypothetical protein [Candidatus Yonathbacteria bacterium]
MTQLTGEDLRQYIGGQMEVQIPDMGLLFRGKIQRVSADDERRFLDITFAWIAERIEEEWVRSDATLYTLIVSEYMKNEAEGGVLYLSHTKNPEHLTSCYPPVHPSNLDPREVKGLELENV